jgi:hypothetical protein
MRTLMRFGFLMSSAITGLVDIALAKSVAEPLLIVEVKGHYGTQWTKIFKSGKNWVCKSEIMPYYEIPTAPFKHQDLKALTRLPADASLKLCRDQVFVVDQTASKRVAFHGCESDPRVFKFIKDLYQTCGR